MKFGSENSVFSFVAFNFTDKMMFFFEFFCRIFGIVGCYKCFFINGFGLP